jgi:hypothetical protein
MPHVFSAAKPVNCDLLAVLLGINPLAASRLRRYGLTIGNAADHYMTACVRARIDPWNDADGVTVAERLQLLGTSLRLNRESRFADAEHVATTIDFRHKIMSSQVAVVEAALRPLENWYDELSPVLVLHSIRKCLFVLVRDESTAQRYCGPNGLKQFEAKFQETTQWEIHRLCAFTTFPFNRKFTWEDACELAYHFDRIFTPRWSGRRANQKSLLRS